MNNDTFALAFNTAKTSAKKATANQVARKMRSVATDRIVKRFPDAKGFLESTEGQHLLDNVLPLLMHGAATNTEWLGTYTDTAVSISEVAFTAANERAAYEFGDFLSELVGDLKDILKSSVEGLTEEGA